MKEGVHVTGPNLTAMTRFVPGTSHSNTPSIIDIELEFAVDDSLAWQALLCNAQNGKTVTERDADRRNIQIWRWHQIANVDTVIAC